MSQKQARYLKANLRLTPKQIAKLAKAGRDGSPAAFVLGGGGNPFTVFLTANQAAKMDQGAKRVKFSPAQIKKMMGAGLIGDTLESAVDIGANALKSVDPTGGILSDLVGDQLGDLVKMIGNEIEFQLTKPDFKAIAANRASAIKKGKALSADPAAATRYAQGIAKAPAWLKLNQKEAQKDPAAYGQKIAARMSGVEPADSKQIEAAYRAKISGGRKMNPKQRPPPRYSSGMGSEAAQIIRAVMAEELKKK